MGPDFKRWVFPSFEQWSAAGSEDMARTSLTDFEAPALDPDTRNELEAFVARHTSEIDPVMR
ncbi:trimethylamine methyltransferase family protein [Roseovarius sp. 2305UL8-3]|uniref:trimethylamine methyltransferase family protein n=1 Tax=Roseovarius conchicola TaxID=3121636 RepID=UPI0035295631